MKINDLERATIHENGKPASPLVYGKATNWLYEGFEKYRAEAALCFGDEQLSYDQLDKRSNKVANYLNSHGVERGDRVGLCLDRSTEMIVCLIGILKAGAAYVPLDPNYPRERLEIMREDAQLSLLLAHRSFSDLFEDNTGQVCYWEDITTEIDQCSNINPDLKISPEDVAYVIFTSGSTGRPKGIAMPHRALANLIEWQLERPYFNKEARVIQYSSISFDVSFQEIATTIASGGTLFLIDDEERRDPRVLLDFINEHEIERLFIPFVALRSLVEVANTQNRLPTTLKEVITAGEQLRVDDGLRSFFSELPEAILENQYGPSETHVISAYLLDEDPEKWSDLPPIGKAIKNNSIYIMDKDRNVVPDGEQGELYLSGINVAHGYLGREDLTKESFINKYDSLGNRQILYKTGDLGFINEEGDVEFLGRADHQIKVRGYRIEPGEINSVGAEYPGIAQCLTHTVDGEGQSTKLVTYYITQDDADVKEVEFKTYLKETLPEYMVPAYIMELDDIPYTPSGKVDLKSLPEPDKQLAEDWEERDVTYQTKVEIELAEIWCNLLDLEAAPRKVSFFDLGGDSLNAVTLFMKIEERFGKYLPLSTLTQAPTLKELAKVIDGSNKDLDLSRFRSLQLIQQGSLDKAPLFLVHGGAGNVLMFKDLAKGLPDDQPVYAFQWSGWDGYKGEDDIIEMARFYKNELREAWPTGPYRLGGHCIGGIIAIEIAKLLRAEGAEVLDPIMVSDSPNLHATSYRAEEPESSESDAEKFEAFVEELDQQIAENGGSSSRLRSQKKNEQGNDYSVRRFPLLAKYVPFYSVLGGLYFKIQDKVQLMRIHLLKNLSLKIPVKDRKRYCSLSQLSATKKHHKTVHDGDVLYFKSEVVRGQKMGLQGWWKDPFFGFEELCSGTFDAHVIGGGHDDLLSKNRTHQIIRKRMFKLNE